MPGHDAEDEFAAQRSEDAIGRLAPAQVSRRALSRGAAAHRIAEAKAVLAHVICSFDPAMESEGYVLAIEPHETYWWAPPAPASSMACRRSSSCCRCPARRGSCPRDGARLAGDEVSRH